MPLVRVSNGGSDSIPEEYYLIVSNGNSPVAIPSNGMTLSGTYVPRIFHTANRPAKIYCRYTTESGFFAIYSISKDGEVTSYGEKANQWVTITDEYIMTAGSIYISIQFQWV